MNLTLFWTRIANSEHFLQKDERTINIALAIHFQAKLKYDFIFGIFLTKNLLLRRLTFYILVTFFVKA